MRHASLNPWILVLLLLAFFTSCGTGAGHWVVAVEKTNIYHRESCAKVNMAETKRISLDSAIAEHMKPCPYCKPEKGT